MLRYTSLRALLPLALMGLLGTLTTFGAAGCPSPGGGTGGPGIDCSLNPTHPLCQPQDTTGDGTPSDTKTDTPNSDVTVDTGPDGTCTPDCAGKTCGPDGCGNFCGSCGNGFTCDSGQCVEGECGQAGATVTGEFKVASGITFDKIETSIEHKMDIDEFEDGCLTTLVFDLGKGFGCVLHVEASTATAPGGGLRVTDLRFSADSQCPGFPDESEGEYTDFSGLTLARVVPAADKVPDKNAPESCLTTNFTIELEGVLRTAGADKTLNVAMSSIGVSGEFKSVGSTTASCPCEASCSGKECGDDGCGFSCGLCEGDNSQCNASGICECVPDCTDKECGDDGCGGSCGDCGEFDTCTDFACVPCEPSCTDKTCGDDGCGGTCGECGTDELCNPSGTCECSFVDCDGTCCAEGDACNAGACCTPQCDGKECGDDGCGGSCGDCGGNGTCDTETGMCICTPNCTGKECGDDGCGGSCGTCGVGETCDTGTGLCGCTPQCTGKQCGPDGCGGQCGTCTGGDTCNTGTGQCESGGLCDVNGYTPAGEIAVNQTNYILWQSATDISGTVPSDVMALELWKSQDGTYQWQSSSVYDLNQGWDYSTCGLCVLINQGCTAAGDCSNAKKFFATAGALTLTDFSGSTGGNLGGALTDLTLVEVTIDPTTYVSTPVPGGETWCIDQVLIGPTQIQSP